MNNPTDDPLKSECDKCHCLEYTSDLRPIEHKFKTLLVCRECFDENFVELGNLSRNFNKVLKNSLNNK